MVKVRVSYTAKFKLAVVRFSEEKGNREAGLNFNVNECSVREWRKGKNVLLKIPKHRRSMRYGKGLWPQLEKEVSGWIKKEREKGHRILTTKIRMYANQLSQSEKYQISNFKASSAWCQRFMKRFNFSIRAATTVGQTLPCDWRAKVESYRLFVQEKLVGVEPAQFGNMDEVPMAFDILGSRTVHTKGEKEVIISSTGHEKAHFTVVLCATSDGGKLPPMIIFKRKTLPKNQKFPNGVIVTCNEKGWINQNMMHFWLDKVWRVRKGGFFRPKSLLALDSCRAHIIPEIKNLIQQYSNLAVIPGGLTKRLQPLDLTVNRSFKSKMREQWEKWMEDGVHTYTKSGRICRVDLKEICNWIKTAWNSVTKECIENGFKKAMEDKENNTKEDEEKSFDICDSLNTERKEITKQLESFNVISDDDFEGFD